MKYGTLAHRIGQAWDPEQALTRPVEHRDRVYTRPLKTIEAFGETKSVSEWAADPRTVVLANVFLRRIQHGWSPESSLTTSVSAAAAKREANAMLYEAFGEEKTLRDWAADERCKVSEMTLRKNIHSGLSMEEAFKFRRKPGRHFLGSQEDFSGALNELRTVVGYLREGGELWVYTTNDVSRISLIHRDARHTLTADMFQELLDKELVEKTFETDTIKNYELTKAGKLVKF